MGVLFPPAQWVGPGVISGRRHLAGLVGTFLGVCAFQCGEVGTAGLWGRQVMSRVCLGLYGELTPFSCLWPQWPSFYCAGGA